VREKRSWIWEYKYNLMEVRSKDTYWKCKICDDQNKINKLYKASSVNAAKGHLVNDHKIQSLKRKKHSTYTFINNEDGVFSSKTAILTSDRPPGSNVFDQLKAAATVSAKSAISLLLKTLTDLFKHYLILWIVSYQIAVSLAIKETV